MLSKFQKVDELIAKLERFEERISHSTKAIKKLDSKFDLILKELRERN